MGDKYPFVKKQIRGEATDLRSLLNEVELCMRTNIYTDWEELQLEIVATAIQLTEKMKGK